MTIQKAIRSKKPFTNPDLDFWIIIKDNRFYVEPKPISTGGGVQYEVKLTFEMNKHNKKQRTATIKHEPSVVWEEKLRPVLLTPKAVMAKNWRVRK